MNKKYTVLGSGLLVLAFIAWMMVATMPAGVIIMLPDIIHVEISQYVIFLVLGISELILLLPLVIYMIVTRTNLKVLMGNRTGWSQNLLAALLGVLLAPALAGISTILSELFMLMGAELPSSAMYEPTSVGTLLAGILAIGACAGIAEEPVFRGVVQRGLGSAFNRRIAVILTALVFSLVHMDIVGAPTRFIIGLVLGFMAWRSGAVLPGVIMHAAYNSAVITIGLVLSKALPDWNGFSVISGAPQPVNNILTWVLISIPFAACTMLVYRQFARVTPKSSSWSDQPYAAAAVKPLHWLAWAAAGFLILSFTALTAFSMWLPKLMQGMNNLPGFGN